MASLKINTIANFIGQTLTALVAFALVPLYIKFLGVESYGLLGFFISLQALLSIMDFGLATTANREVARSATDPDHINEVLSTLQYVYVTFGLLIVAFFVLFSRVIATDWITATALSFDTVTTAIILFGITLGMRWPIGLYSGILRGVEKQVVLNLITITATVLKGAGSALIVIFVPDSLLQIIEWQLFAGTVELVFYAVFAWRSVPHSALGKFRFSMPALKSVLGFSCTVAFISIFAVVIKQLDKVIISKLLPLEELGYYTTAFQAYTAIQIFISPVSTAVFPRLSSIVNSVDQAGLADIYHKTTKIISFVSAPIAVTFIFFSYDIILLWTKSELIASRSHVTLSILAVAALFNSVMQASFILQLAAGLQKLALVNNMVAFLLFTPLTFFLVQKFGIVGGAISWATYNILYFSVMPSITHRYILRGHLVSWMLRDTAPFMLLSVGILGTCYLLTSHFSSALRLFFTGIAFVLYAMIAIVIDPTIKSQFTELYAFLQKKLKPVYEG